MDETTKIAIFKGRRVRKIIYHNEWWFSVIDIIQALTETERPRKYWNDLKVKIKLEGYIEVSEKIGQLKLTAPDGKMRETDCANTETLFRIIQSIPSPKAEPFKRWLAREGGTIAGNAKRELEQKSGQNVSTSGNYLRTPQNRALPKI